IWEVVEDGMNFDSNYNAIFINDQIHKNHLYAGMNTTKYTKIAVRLKEGIMWSGSPHDYSKLRIFSCTTYAHASNKKGQAREIVEFTSILYWHNLHIILHVFHMLEYLLYFLLYNIDYDFGQSFYFQWDTWLLNLYGLLEDQYSRFALFSSLVYFWHA
ncbi:hypothetical protein ACJX0J_034868, partial [Zea mays]